MLLGRLKELKHDTHAKTEFVTMVFLNSQVFFDVKASQFVNS